MTEAEVVAARQLRGAGSTNREIAAHLSVDESTVRRRIGSKGQRRGRRRLPLTAAVVVEAWVANGGSLKVAARELNVSKTVVARRLAEAGEIAWPAWIRKPAWVEQGLADH